MRYASPRKVFSLISTPIPTFLTLSRDLIVERKDSMSVTGRLSMQKKPVSSRALRATVLPAPESPLTMTTPSLLFPSSGMRDSRRLFHRFDEAVIAVAAAVNDVDIAACKVCKDEEVLVEEIH